MFKQHTNFSPASLISIVASAILVAMFGISISNLVSSSALNSTLDQSHASVSSLER